MSFSEAYHLEVLQSRQVRAQRAFFWARVVGFALMITVAATLRADPQLRAALMQASINGVSQMANLTGSGQVQTPQPRPSAPLDGALPRTRVKINRPGDGAKVSDQQIDAAALAAQIERTLAAQIERTLAAQRIGN